MINTGNTTRKGSSGNHDNMVCRMTLLQLACQKYKFVITHQTSKIVNTCPAAVIFHKRKNRSNINTRKETRNINKRINSILNQIIPSHPRLIEINRNRRENQTPQYPFCTIREENREDNNKKKTKRSYRMMYTRPRDNQIRV
jgi:hypothetical protein